MISLYIFTLYLSFTSMFVVIKFLLHPTNRWSYYNSLNNYKDFTFSRRIIDNINYLSIILLLLYGYIFTSIIFLFGIFISSLILFFFNKIPIYFCKIILVYASQPIKFLFKYRNINSNEEFFLIGLPFLNISTLILTIIIWVLTIFIY